MNDHTSNLIVGQGIAGTSLAWQLHFSSQDFVILDTDDGPTASRVAAGLVTPWTGRRMTQSEDFDESWQEALSFYRRVEDVLSRPLFEITSAIRLFRVKSDREKFENRSRTGAIATAVPWSGTLQTGGELFEGCRMQPTGRLNVKSYLEASADFFRSRYRWYRHELDMPNGLVFEGDRVLVPKLDLIADRVIFCQGAVSNPWFPGVPDNPSKGEILNVKVSGWQLNEPIHDSIWLASEEDGTITVGATYNWNYTDDQPSSQGRREILNAMRRFVTGEIMLNEHHAAVRPAMKDYQPVIGQHPEIRQLFVFNGLGSRGVLRAPRLAQILTTLLIDGDVTIPEAQSVRRLHRNRDQKSLTRIAQDIVEQYVGSGDTVVDATAGNGFDTCFLAERVGPRGRVYGFDVQEAAIESTRRRLIACGMSNVELILQSHQRLNEYVHSPVSAAMFNLGYLPRSDHSVTTQASSTIEALDQIRSRLRSGGIVTILAYRGHPGGSEEAEAVECWLRNQNDCTIELISSATGGNSSPVLFVLVNSREKTDFDTKSANLA